MFARGPLLTVQQGSSGTFVRFLHEIGLEEFLKQYPVSQLIEWGWLIPYRRVIFPAEYFENWRNFPYFGEQSSREYENYGLLWDATWEIDDDSEHLWFLHPTFRPGDETEQLLQANAVSIPLPAIPGEFHHSNGVAIKPYVDYFFVGRHTRSLTSFRLPTALRRFSIHPMLKSARKEL